MFLRDIIVFSSYSFFFLFLQNKNTKDKTYALSQVHENINDFARCVGGLTHLILKHNIYSRVHEKINDFARGVGGLIQFILKHDII